MAKIKEIKLYIPQGTTYEHTFNYAASYEEDGTPIGPIDISTYTARMQFRDTVDAADPPIYDATSLVCGNGTVILTITDTETAAFTFEKCKFDLEIESPGGVVTRLVKGTVYLDEEVTR